MQLGLLGAQCVSVACMLHTRVSCTSEGVCGAMCRWYLVVVGRICFRAQQHDLPQHLHLALTSSVLCPQHLRRMPKCEDTAVHPNETVQAALRVAVR